MNISTMSYKAILFAVLIFLPVSAVFAQQDRPERPEKIEFPELNPIVVPEVHTFEHNGIQFFLVEDDELPLINMNVRIRAGGWMVPEEQVALHSITGEVMRSGGTVNIPGDELNELLESRATNMETSFGLTSGNASMSLLKEDFEEMLPIFIELLTQPAFPEDKLDLAKTQRRSGISRRNDSPSSIAAREFQHLIYGRQSVFSRTLEYDHLDMIELDDLKEFHRRAVTNQNLMVGISGDFNVDQIRPMLEEAFAAIPEGPKNEFDFPEIDYTFEPSINFIHRSNMNQSIIRMGHIGGFRDNPDYAALQVMNQILSGGFSGRLMQEVRTRQGLAYSVSGSYGSNVLYPGQFFAGLSTDGERTAEAINATIHEIRRLMEEPVSQEELDDTRDRFLNSLVFRNADRASALNEQLNNTYVGLPLDAFERYVDEVREVTPEDIHRVAREYLRPDDLQILVVGNRDLVGDQLEEFGEVNKIDVSIPRPGEFLATGEREEAPAVEGDAEAGAEWIGRMSSALLNGNTISEIVYTGSAEMFTPQGNLQGSIKLTYGFPDKMIQELNVQGMDLVLSYENGSAKMTMGPQEQNLGDAAAESYQNTIDKHYLNIAMKAGDLSVLYTGEEELDGTPVAVLYVEDYKMKIKVDKETFYPLQVSYTDFDFETGSEVEAVVTYSDFNESDGIVASWSQRATTNGEPQLVLTFTEHNSN